MRIAICDNLVATSRNTHIGKSQIEYENNNYRNGHCFGDWQQCI
jgi:hypothetical protein